MNSDGVGHHRSVAALSILILGVLALSTNCAPPASGGAGAGDADITGVHVDTVRGSDTLTGHPNTPLKTITRALEIAGRYSTVYVNDGVYDQNSGENFPLVLTQHVRLIAVGSDVVVSGGGDYFVEALGTFSNTAIVFSGYNELSHLTVQNDSGFGVFVDSNSVAIVSDNQIRDCEYGIVVSDGGTAIVSGNTISGCTLNGLQAFGQSTVSLYGNNVTHNEIGVFLGESTRASVGTEAEPGENVFRQNSRCDMLNLTNTTLDAIGNLWDELPGSILISSTCENGNDVVSPNALVVLEYSIDSDTNLFPNTEPIEIVAPYPWAQITSQTPTFRWQPTNNRHVVAAVFDSPAVVADGNIDNTDDIVWIWHSGLGLDDEGNVSFKRGVDGIQSGQPTEPLERGRTYYWAIWAWDDLGAHVTHASPLTSFGVGY